MTWLTRVKNEDSIKRDATKATEPTPKAENGGFVGFVAYKPRGTENLTPASDASKSLGTWSSGTAWNAAEIETFERRLALFTDRGLTLTDAEALAERLLARDRDGDERTLCIECAHYRHGRCVNWKAAGFVKSRDADALGDYASTLQRCPGFTPAIQSGGRPSLTLRSLASSTPSRSCTRPSCAPRWARKRCS